MIEFLGQKVERIHIQYRDCVQKQGSCEYWPAATVCLQKSTMAQVRQKKKQPVNNNHD